MYICQAQLVCSQLYTGRDNFMDMNRVGENIKYLRGVRNLSQARLAELCGWENASRISNYENTPRQPSLEDIEIIARALRTDPAALAFEDCTRKKNLYPLFMGVPILDWDDVTNWPHDKSNILDSKKIDFLYIQPPENAASCYALQVKDDSMVSKGAKHSFRAGSYIVVDPDKKYSNEDFVIAQNEKDATIFREYTNYSGDEYLSMLNDKILERSIRLTPNIKICGVVVLHVEELKRGTQ